MTIEPHSSVTPGGFKERCITGADGVPLRCLCTAIERNRPSILITMPFGVPAHAASSAIDALGAHRNLVIWEGRYILDANLPFSGDEPVAPADYVRDMRAVLRALEIDRCQLVGYCSGAGIALAAAREYPEIFANLILVNGEYQLFRRGHVATAYQRSIDSFLPVVAGSRQAASSIFATMADVNQASGVEMESELQRLMSTPFSTEERLFRYARTYMAYRDFDALALTEEIEQTTFVVTGRRDEHSNMENSEAVNANLSRSKLFIDDEGDHYAFCRPGSQTLAEIAAYIST